MTRLDSLDTPAIYVDALSRLFWHAQVIGALIPFRSRPLLADIRTAADRHLACLSPPGISSSSYNSIGPQVKAQIEQRLRRVSDYYGTFVCHFVVADLGLLLDVRSRRSVSCKPGLTPEITEICQEGTTMEPGMTNLDSTIASQCTQVKD